MTDNPFADKLEDKPDELESKITPPRGVIILAGILFITGFMSFINMFFQWVQGVAFVDATCLLVFLAAGVAHGRDQALRWVWVLCVSLIVIQGFVVFGSTGSVWSLIESEAPSALVSMVIVLGVAIGSLILVTRHGAREWFRQAEGPVLLPLRSAAWAMAIAVVLVLCPVYVRDWQEERVFERTFLVDVDITLVDAETVAAINNVSFDTSPMRYREEHRHKNIIASFSGYGDRSKVSLRGFSSEPFDYWLGSEGYEPQAVSIDSETARSLVVKLQKASD